MRPMGKMSPDMSRTSPAFSVPWAAVDEVTAPSPMSTPAATARRNSRHAGEGGLAHGGLGVVVGDLGGAEDGHGCSSSVNRRASVRLPSFPREAAPDPAGPPDRAAASRPPKADEATGGRSPAATAGWRPKRCRSYSHITILWERARHITPFPWEARKRQEGVWAPRRHKRPGRGEAPTCNDLLARETWRTWIDGRSSRAGRPGGGRRTLGAAGCAPSTWQPTTRFASTAAGELPADLKESDFEFSIRTRAHYGICRRGNLRHRRSMGCAGVPAVLTARRRARRWPASRRRPRSRPTATAAPSS